MNRSTFPPKHCACGEMHTRDAWQALALVGHMTDETECIELRNCTCGSTLAIVAGEP